MRAVLHAPPALCPPPHTTHTTQTTLSFIKQRGDVTLDDIVRFIKETVSAFESGAGHAACGSGLLRRLRAALARLQTQPSVCGRPPNVGCSPPAPNLPQGISKQALQEDDVQRIISVRPC